MGRMYTNWYALLDIHKIEPGGVAGGVADSANTSV